ncbi:glycine-rich RNA-binding, abscisic acid-inducible protein isoform X2 [Jatropha curcas]|uniref:glycine-rich RNA-binding, abscisic acid-inducible protein isoform X2 n=1 Tax=Jatropha curcas TaxID=180498 RepID=UPI0009D76FD9|nr:glycine-rich RNA-binding, abscisic acid-inducible protein isoform X2 [Jatropha curcas]
MAKRIGWQLFVGRLSAYATNQKLEKWFSPFGVVREARLVIDPRTRKPKGFGFVTFDSESEALKAMKTMNGRHFSCYLSPTLDCCSNRFIPVYGGGCYANR